ncbi:hypothetical protein [Thioflexithrix psekupsensis]|uniref:hypothetical protein n=1 Tax=Thioflexithrix psekupsensis TaxID=1570016 RepID=UPI001592E95B|nr:hypothetical protein [Thioflexithrix psekupsensis]
MPQEVRDNSEKEMIELDRYCAEKNNEIHKQMEAGIIYAFLAGIFLIISVLSYYAVL